MGYVDVAISDMLRIIAAVISKSPTMYVNGRPEPIENVYLVLSRCSESKLHKNIKVILIILQQACISSVQCTESQCWHLVRDKKFIEK